MSAPRKSAQEKAVPRHVSVPRVLDDFVMKMGLSHSRLLQEKIESLMQEHPEYLKAAEASEIEALENQVKANRDAYLKKHGKTHEQVLEEARRQRSEADLKREMALELEEKEARRLWEKAKRLGLKERAATPEGIRTFVQGNIRDKQLFNINPSREDHVCQRLHDYWLEERDAET